MSTVQGPCAERNRETDDDNYDTFGKKDGNGERGGGQTDIQTETGRQAGRQRYMIHKRSGSHSVSDYKIN